MPSKKKQSAGIAFAEVTMEQEKETPGTWRYAEVSPKTGQRIPRDEVDLGIIYIPKDLLELLDNPKQITVTITAR